MKFLQQGTTQVQTHVQESKIRSPILMGGQIILLPSITATQTNRGRLWGNVWARERLVLSSEDVPSPRDAAGAAVWFEKGTIIHSRILKEARETLHPPG